MRIFYLVGPLNAARNLDPAEQNGKVTSRIPDTKLDEFGLRTGLQEPGLIELKDGSVMKIIRTQHQRIYKSYTKDGGDTWSKPEPIDQLIAPVSPATIMRIPTTGVRHLVSEPLPELLARTVRDAASLI